LFDGDVNLVKTKEMEKEWTRKVVKENFAFLFKVRKISSKPTVFSVQIWFELYLTVKISINEAFLKGILWEFLQPNFEKKTFFIENQGNCICTFVYFTENYYCQNLKTAKTQTVLELYLNFKYSTVEKVQVQFKYITGPWWKL
jgi:hypothetical protein